MGASKKERDELSKEMKRILYTLVNSVKNHLEDHKRSALSKRIESTVNKELFLNFQRR
jgi:predicted secreted Zn-dependent protease